MSEAQASKPRTIFEGVTPILAVRQLEAHPPTNYPWAYETQLEDPDGNVRRIGSAARIVIGRG